jgi:hypothetical protein
VVALAIVYIVTEDVHDRITVKVRKGPGIVPIEIDVVPGIVHVVTSSHVEEQSFLDARIRLEDLGALLIGTGKLLIDVRFTIFKIFLRLEETVQNNVGRVWERLEVEVATSFLVRFPNLPVHEVDGTRVSIEVVPSRLLVVGPSYVSSVEVRFVVVFQRKGKHVRHLEELVSETALDTAPDDWF